MPKSEDMDDFTYRFYHCMICYERYDYDEHLNFALASCGHKLCYSCLQNLHQCTCPFCRKEFTVDDIILLRN